MATELFCLADLSANASVRVDFLMMAAQWVHLAKTAEWQDAWFRAEDDRKRRFRDARRGPAHLSRHLTLVGNSPATDKPSS